MQDANAVMTREYSGRTKMAVLAVLSALACVLTCIYIYVPSGSNGVTNITLLILIHVFPLALLCALYNSDVAIIAYAVVLAIGIFTLRDVSIICLSHLAYIFIVAICKSMHCYRSIPKTALAILFSGISMGIVYYFIYSMYFHVPFLSLNFSGVLLPVLLAMPQNAFIHSFIYLCFRFMPSWLVGIFPPGEYRNDTRDNSQHTSFGVSEKKLSRKMSFFLTAEGGILAVGAIFFANLSIPNLNASSYSLNNAAEATGRISTYIPILSELGFTEGMFSGYGIENINDYIDFISSEKLINMPLNALVDFDLHLVMFLIELVIPVVVLIKLLVHKLVTVPVQNITKCMEEYYGDNSEEARRQATIRLEDLNIRTGDEIKSLHETLVVAVKDINQYIDRLKEEQKLKEELSAAQSANRAKTNFLSSVSHEIRTPINSILGFDEMIQRESTEPEIRRYAADIQNSGRTLLSLINDILDSSRIESGKLEIIPVEYELSPMLSDLVNMTNIRVKEKSLEFKVNVDTKLPSALFGDEIRIKQCILNILTNAVKYTKEGSVTLNISFRKAESEGFIYLKAQVTDTGIGIKQEDIDKLFKPFERIEEERNRSVEGTGLGMSIVRSLLNMMGSELEVSSVYGSGSDFSFEVLQKVVKKEPVGDFMESYLNAAKEESDYRESFQAPDARVLVVDDMRLNLSVFCGLLKNTRVVIDAVESGFAAITMVKENAYDVIFLDQRMPDMDGIETLHILKDMDGNLSRNAPVIVLTANAVSGAREEYIGEGFDDYVSKPVDGKKLEDTLRQYLPPSKILYPGHPDFGANDVKKGGEKDARISAIMSIPEISYERAVENCSNDALLLDTAANFVTTAKTLSDDIKRYHSEGDYKNVTVKVHGLKSSARLIGAEKLSADAAYLEQCGDEGRNGEIDARLDRLLEDHRDVVVKLADAIGVRSGLSMDSADERELITEAALNEAYGALREFAEAMDYDGADDIIKMLSGYRMPEGEAERFEKLKTYVAGLNREEILKLL